MMKNFLKLNCLIIFLSVLSMQAQEVIKFKPTDGDMTSVVRNALENVTAKDIKLIFEKGTYKFCPIMLQENFHI